MAAKNNCIKRDVCIFAKESFCKSNSECGHYIMEKGFTSTNSKSMPCCDVCGGPLRSDGDCASRIAHLYGE